MGGGALFTVSQDFIVAVLYALIIVVGCGWLWGIFCFFCLVSVIQFASISVLVLVDSFHEYPFGHLGLLFCVVPYVHICVCFISL